MILYRVGRVERLCGRGCLGDRFFDYFVIDFLDHVRCFVVGISFCIVFCCVRMR